MFGSPFSVLPRPIKSRPLTSNRSNLIQLSLQQLHADILRLELDYEPDTQGSHKTINLTHLGFGGLVFNGNLDVFFSMQTRAFDGHNTYE